MSTLNELLTNKQPKPAPKPCMHCGELIGATHMGDFGSGSNIKPLYFQVHTCPVLMAKATSPYSNVAGGPSQ